MVWGYQVSPQGNKEAEEGPSAWFSSLSRWLPPLGAVTILCIVGQTLAPFRQNILPIWAGCLRS